MSESHTSQTTQDTAGELVDGLTQEQRADQIADQRVVLGVFCLLVVMAVVYVSGWSPQF